VFYVVDKPTEDWKGGRGYINKDVLLKALPSPSDDTVILVDAQLQAQISTVDKYCYVKQY
jgi:NAD(P)H-flavin reductase